MPRYPQYDGSDYIESVGEGDMLVEHLAQMFPEDDDAPPPPFVPRDRHHEREYRCSELVTYLLCDAVRRFGFNEPDPNTGAVAWAQWRANLAAAATGGAAGADAERARAALRACESHHAVNEAAQAWLEIHPGCTFGDILRHERHVIAGGVVNLTVFPRNSPSHTEWRKRESRPFLDEILLPPRCARVAS